MNAAAASEIERRLREYRIHSEGRQAAAGGAGLLASPYAGHDGDLWRGGWQAWIDEQVEADQAPG